VGLAVVLAVNAAIAAGYYLRIISAMYFRSTKRGVQADGGLAAGLAMLACTAALLLVTLRPQGLFQAASRAGDALTGTLPAAMAVDPSPPPATASR
jgi:NADH:ubiquinone oxidoreductase subunit 2 (subunit N)